MLDGMCQVQLWFLINWHAATVYRIGVKGVPVRPYETRISDTDGRLYTPAACRCGVVGHTMQSMLTGNFYCRRLNSLRMQSPCMAYRSLQLIVARTVEAPLKDRLRAAGIGTTNGMLHGAQFTGNSSFRPQLPLVNTEHGAPTFSFAPSLGSGVFLMQNMIKHYRIIGGKSVRVSA